MDLETRKINLLRWVAELNDIRIIKDLESLKNQTGQTDDSTKSNIVGYDVEDGTPITSVGLKSELEQNIAAIENGKFTSQEDLRKKFNRL